MNSDACILDARTGPLERKISSDLGSSSLKYWHSLLEEMTEQLDRAIAGPDEELANRVWFLHAVMWARSVYVNAWEQMRAGRFYEAWCELERAEIALRHINMNPYYELSRFKVLELRKAVGQRQQLFPYKFFISPEFTIKEKVCNICNLSVSPWLQCPHDVGRVYHGVLCYRRITHIEMLSLFIVANPVQKYSVPFLGGKDDGEKDVCGGPTFGAV